MNSTLSKSSQPFLVRKNPYLKSTMDKLYEHRHETGDIKFIIGREEIHAHRCVLAALSPKYKAQFYGAMSEKDVINVTDVSPVAFDAFLQFFYTDEVTLTIENIEDVLNLAQQSLVEGLVEECTQYLVKMMGMDKLLWCYQLAIDYEIEPLKEFCVKQISANIKSVFQLNEFLEYDREMLCHILDIDSLNCNELEVFDACISWAQAKCKRDGIDVTNATHLRAALGTALYKIRFCSMTGEQFATIGKQHLGLISAKESIEVFQTIVLKAKGETSSTFGRNNSKARGRIQMSLECSVGQGSPIKTSKLVGTGSLKFLCGKEINLNGFVICNEIEIHEIFVDGEEVRNYITSVSDNQTKITFHNPIEIEQFDKCVIKIFWNPESQSATDWYRFDWEEKVEQNGVFFKFGEGGYNETNVITRLLYNLIDEP